MEKPIAILTLKAPGKMEQKRRHDIAEWLRQHADELEKNGALYTDRTFTGRYLLATCARVGV